jgi:3-deoxy-D-manno-octulosonic-acid transferase
MNVLLAQSDDDRERLLGLGADPDRVRVMGSAKYDVVEIDPASTAQAEATLRLAGIGETDLVLLGGSTWPGEEAILARVYRKLKVSFPTLRLVLVPRHAERRAEVEAVLKAEGVSWLRRSELAAADGRAADVLLVDTTGELKHLYGCADVVFVGKSLTCTGGQNILEPALHGRPVVVGPHLENFPDVERDFREAAALVQVPDEQELAAEVELLLGDKEAREELGKRARDLVLSRRGVIDASVRELLDLVVPCSVAVGRRGVAPAEQGEQNGAVRQQETQ